MSGPHLSQRPHLPAALRAAPTEAPSKQLERDHSPLPAARSHCSGPLQRTGDVRLAQKKKKKKRREPGPYWFRQRTPPPPPQQPHKTPNLPLLFCHWLFCCCFYFVVVVIVFVFPRVVLQGIFGSPGKGSRNLDAVVRFLSVAD